MVRNSVPKIIYAGLHKETLPLLCDNFDVVGVAQIDFFSKKTLNPFNYVFKLIYLLRRRDKFRSLELFLLKIWLLVKWFSSSVFYDYRDYIETISCDGAKIIDFDHSDEANTYIKTEKVDLLVVNTWEMLPANIIFSPRLGTINVHPSKLPQYRGALPTLWSLKNRDTESAITYMVLDNSMDGGKIIRQHNFSLDSSDDWHSIELKATKVITETIVRVLLDYYTGEVTPHSQDLLITSFTSKYEDYRRIDWQKEAGRDIYNKINLYPFVEADVFCYTFHRNRKIFIKGATIKSKVATDINKNRFFIAGLCLCVDMGNVMIEIRLFRDLDFFSSVSLIFWESVSDLYLTK